MTLQNQKNKGIPAGFGERLKKERRRLGLSQEVFAQIGGVQRLAQIQYENENTAPTTRYLNLISLAGVDLSYLLLAIVAHSTSIAPERMEYIENKTFQLIEKFSESTTTGKLSADTFKMLFKLIRGILIQVEEGKLAQDVDIMALISGG